MVRFCLIILMICAALSEARAYSRFPSGGFRGPVEQSCYPENAFRQMDPETNAPVALQTAHTQLAIDRCERSWSQGGYNALANLISFSMLKYPTGQSYLKEVMLPLKDGRMIRALLAVKPGNKSRDLVVIRCGIFCNTSPGTTVSTALMNVFEENPLHVLLLVSAAGANYAEDNGISHIGGFDEGYQNLEAAEFMLANQEHFGLSIRKIHLMGFSLGGLSALFSSFYSNVVPSFANLPVASFTAVCPMVDLESQVREVIVYKPFASYYFQNELQKFFSSILPFVKPLEKFLLSGQSSGLKEFEAALNMSAHYYERSWSSLGFSPYLEKPQGVLKESDLLELSSITNYVNRFSRPTLLVHAKDDRMVPWENHGAKLLGLQDENFGILTFARGDHCAFATTHGWSVFSELLTKSFGLSQDLPLRKQPLPPTLSKWFSGKKLWKSQTYSLFRWEIEPHSPIAKLVVFIHGTHLNGNGCRYSKPTRMPLNSRPEDCQTVTSVKIPLKELSSLGLKTDPMNSLEASRAERYLNGRTRIKTKRGKLAVGEKEAPVYLEVQGKFDPESGVL